MSELPEGLLPAEPSEPVDSALAIVLRQGPGSRELLLGLRSARARFLPGHLAFPGGRLDPVDAPQEPGALARCASRELREETGLEVEAGAWLDAGERVTPPLFPLRFRTRFLLTDLATSGSSLDLLPANDENERLVFNTARDVLDQWERGDCKVAPPLLPILRAVAQAGDLAPDAVALRIQAVNAEQERRPQIEFLPGVSAVAVRTATLPPATHTNVWLAGTKRFAIVDPGSAEPGEIRLLLEVIERRRRAGDQPVAVLLTHAHRDHMGGAVALARALGLPVRAHPVVLEALDPSRGQATLLPFEEGQEIELHGLRLRALYTPGHAPGHLAFLASERHWLICGDLLSGLSTILIDPRTGGDMEAYLTTLERVRGLACTTFFPGHGPPLPGAEIDRAVGHRCWREARVLEVLGLGPASLAAIARQAYAEMPQMPAALAESQTLAHLVWLERRGLARRADEAGTSWSADRSRAGPA